MILFLLFRLLTPTTLQTSRREVLRLRSIIAEAWKDRNTGQNRDY